MNDCNVAEFRELSVLASGGTSGAPVKVAVLRALAKLPKFESLVDVGAGKGELLTVLRDLYPLVELGGADYMARPDNLPGSIKWLQADLNEPFDLTERFQVVVCSEVIEHLENPRQLMRRINDLLLPGGTLILTTPNQESLRSYAALLAGGHFAAFLGPSYPAHITALLRLDLERICTECGLHSPKFSYTNYGGLPKAPRITWQRLSFGMLKGRLFSDNLVLVTNKPK